MYIKKHTGQNKISRLEKYSFLGKTTHEQPKLKGLGIVLWDKRQKLLFLTADNLFWTEPFFFLLSFVLFIFLNKVLQDLHSHAVSYSKTGSY